MRAYLLGFAGALLLTGCRESGLATQSVPSSSAAPRVMRLDTTFLPLAQHNRAFRYTAALRVGPTGRGAAIPVEINWTAIEYRGCPQIASVQVYQLTSDGRRLPLQARVRRDSTCRPGLGADGVLGTATTGMALVSLTGPAREAHYTITTSCLINALGFHDALDYGDAPANVWASGETSQAAGSQAQKLH